MRHGSLTKNRGRLGPIKFTAENLTRIGNNLMSKFFVTKLDFKIVVRGRKYVTAAEVDLNSSPPVIYMYKPYHDRYPSDYKITLLHEFGHIFLGVTHDAFHKYWERLRRKDVVLGLGIIPDTYSGFVFSRRPNKFRDQWICPECSRVIFYRKRVNMSKCNSCGIVRVRTGITQQVLAGV